MATTHYNLPTIVGTDTIDGVNAINGLANSVDAALFGVAGTIPPEYQLPIAGTTSLGGVRGAGDISVNPTDGNMTITSGAVTSSKIASGGVNAGNIANSAVGSAALDSNVMDMLQKGVNAYNQDNVSGQRSNFTNWSDKNGFIATAHNGFYVVYPSIKCVLVKINIQGSLNLGTNINSEFCSVTLPSQYSIPFSYETFAGLTLNPGDNLPIVYRGVVNGDTIGISCTNFGARSGTASSISVTFNALIPYVEVSQ